MCMGSDDSAMSIAKTNINSRNFKNLEAMVKSGVASDDQKKKYQEMLKNKQ